MEAISLGVAICALVASCGAAFWAGRLDARVNNGLQTKIQEVHNDVGRLFDKLDGVPCDRHDERMKHIEQTVKRLEEGQ